MAKETAEQKLLKLIEQTQGDAGGSAPVSVAAQDPVQAPAVSSQAEDMLASVQGVGIKSVDLSGSVEAVLARLKGLIISPDGSLGLREINRVLLIVIAVGIFYFVGYIGKGLGLVKKTISFPSAKSVSVKTKSILPEFMDVAIYQEGMALRNIFNPYEKVEPKKEEVMTEEETSTAKVKEKIKDLKLVGISWLDTPESASAMIENTANGVTYFLHLGDDVNDVVVKEIYMDSIVIEYNGEQTELHL